MAIEQLHWAGAPFVPVFHHDAHFFRCPGLFAFVHRHGQQRTLLFVGQSENIAACVQGHRFWAEALGLEFDELDVCTRAVLQVDRLVLCAHIVKRCSPLLNLLEEQSRPLRPANLIAGRRRT